MKIQEANNLSTSFLQIVKKTFSVFVILIAPFLLVSCFFSANIAPTVDVSRNSINKSSMSDRHQVKSGETLFSIAWRYGLDYKALAKFNGIGNDFLIYAGQTLILPGKNTSTPSSRSVSAPKKRDHQTSVARRSSSSSTARSSSVSQNTTKKASSSSQRVARSEKKSSPVKKITKSNSSTKKVKWQWPTNGKVVTNFSSSGGLNKGIDIRGKKGDSVNAAASGRIVYAGSGLRGYGKLIIIKHNDTYLSAYAHNNRIRVKEGQTVKAGQHIADIGSSGSRTDAVKLHFEIRRNGQPVNPLKLLPKRKT